jgi:probable HAF family extracellular repeat protein
MKRKDLQKMERFGWSKNNRLQRLKSWAVAIGIMVTMTGANTVADGATFQGLGTLIGDDTSTASGISGDGKVVVGVSDTDAFRWENGTMTWLGALGCAIAPWSEALAVSKEGTHIVGVACYLSDADGFIWTQQNGMKPLNTKPGQTRSFRASAVSANGQFAAGINDLDEAFGWSEAEGVVSLGTLPGHDLAEGKGIHYVPPFPPPFPRPSLLTVVGESWYTPDHHVEAFSWDNRTFQMIGLGYLPGDTDSAAHAISRDGRTIVGYSGKMGTTPRTTRGVRWVSGVAEALTPASFSCEANAVSADGSVVVGGCGLGLAWIWDAAHGFRNLKDVLTLGFGLDLTGWGLSEATGVSDDGNKIVGYALLNPVGNTEGWIADITTANDGKQDAQDTQTGQTSGSLAGASPDGDDSCGGTGSPDVWYRFTAPAQGFILVDSCGTNDLDGLDATTDTILSLHSGDGSTEHGCNDNWTASANNSRCQGVDLGSARDSYVEHFLNPGESVLIRVARYPDTEIPARRFVLNIEFEPMVGCLGDFDGDSDVDGSDLAIFAADFGRTNCGGGLPCEGDFDNDNDVDGTDLAKFAEDFGRTDCP